MAIMRNSLLGLLLRFGSVGVAATAIYFVLALVFQWHGALGATPSSLLAYAVAALFSYMAHRSFTFGSQQAHGSALPRFIVTTLLGALLALAIPYALHDTMGLPAYVPVIAVCILIPLINLLVLRFWVFPEQRRD